MTVVFFLFFQVSRIKNYYYEFSLSNESLKELLETPDLVQLDQAEFVGKITIINLLL